MFEEPKQLYLDHFHDTLLELAAFNGKADRSDRCLDALIALRNLEASHTEKLFNFPSADELFDQLEHRYMRRLAQCASDVVNLQEQFNYQTQKLEHELVLANKNSPEIVCGENERKPIRVENRLESLLAALQLELGVSKQDFVIRQDSPETGRVRTEPYFLISFPGKGIHILICNQVGEGLFFSREPLRLPLSKEQILAQGGKKINVDIEGKWVKKLLSELVAAGVGSTPSRQSNSRTNRFSSDYYTKDTVYFDLLSFALQTNDPSLYNLTTANNSMPTLKARCLSGEVITGNTYMSHAAIALGLAVDSIDVGTKRAVILAELKSIAGCVPHDGKYLRNKDNVFFDLKAFRDAIGIDTFAELNTHNINRITIYAANGQKVTGAVYLTNAGTALGLAPDRRAAMKCYKKTLQNLKVIAGVLPTIFTDRDRAYFENPTYVREDLISIAIESGKQSIADVVKGNAFDSTFRSCNGETSSGRVWLNQASLAFGFSTCKEEHEAVATSTLNYLKELAGVPVIDLKEHDKAYYLDRDNVSHDLALYAKNYQVAGIADLKTVDFIANYPITCASGRRMTGDRYLLGAIKEFGFSEQRGDRLRSRIAVLSKLKEVCGITQNDANQGSEI